MDNHEFKFFDIIGWVGFQGVDLETEETKFNKIHRIIVDQNVTLRGRDVHPMPKYLRELSFCYEYNRPFTQIFKLNEMTSLTKLTLGCKFNRPIIPSTFPESLLDLTFGGYYNKPLYPGMLPYNLTKLSFIGGNFNHPLASFLPKSLIELTLSDQFNQEIAPGTFSENLSKLTFGCRFNKLLIPGVLPDSLTELTFAVASDFNKIIDPGVLPRNLKKIKFGKSFNQPLKPGCFPDSLTHIVFGRVYNQLLTPGVLPPHLVKLKFGYNMCDDNYIQSINSFGSFFDQPLPFDMLSNSLTHLCFAIRSSFNQPIIAVSRPRGTDVRSCLNVIFGRDYRLYLCEPKYPDVLVHIYTTLTGDTVSNEFQTDIDTKQFNF